MLNCLTELRGPVRLEPQPQLERAQRARILECDVNRVRVLSVVRHVGLIVSERGGEGRVVTHENNRAGLRHEHPLVCVDGDRVGEVEPVELFANEVGAGGGAAVSSVDVHPHVVLLGDASDLAQRVYRAGERRARRGDDARRPDAGGDVLFDLGFECGRVHAMVVIDRNRSHRACAEAKQFDRALVRVVRLARHIDGHRHRVAELARFGHRPLAGRGERSDVAHRATRGEEAAAGKANEFGHPLARLNFKKRGCSRIDSNIDVVRRRQEVGYSADLKSARADVGKEARARLCE